LSRFFLVAIHIATEILAVAAHMHTFWLQNLNNRERKKARNEKKGHAPHCSRPAAKHAAHDKSAASP
jgi:hypothetical protein